MLLTTMLLYLYFEHGSMESRWKCDDGEGSSKEMGLNGIHRNETYRWYIYNKTPLPGKIGFGNKIARSVCMI